MTTSFIVIDNINIAYCEQNADAEQTVFFIHGNSGSSKMWSKQFESKLFNSYRMIAIDLPGHGNSSKAIYPKDDYNPLNTAKVIAKAFNKLSASKPSFLVGFSYGTNLIAEILPFINRPLGIVLVGACVVGTDYGADKVITDFGSIFLQQKAEKTVAEKFLLQQLYDMNDLNLYLEDYYRTDPFFRTALIENANQGNVSDEIKILKETPCKILAVSGDNDNLVNKQYMECTGINLWNHKSHLINEAGHFVSSDQHEKFNLILHEYISETSITSFL